MTTVALIPYRSQLPAVLRDEVQRLGAAILRTLDRIGIRAGQTGVVFDRVRVHRGEFISFTIEAQSLSAEDQSLILQDATCAGLQALAQKPIVVTRDGDQLLIVIDLREPTRSWRVRLRRWLKQ